MSKQSLHAALVILALGAGSARADLSTGLIAYYPFNGNAQDASPNLNHGTPNATAVLITDRFGNPASAYQFNGTNSAITVPNSASLSSPTTAITHAAWIMMVGQSLVGSAFSPITMKSATGENAMMYRFYTANGSIGVSYGNWNNGVLSAATLPYNQWHHVASTFDGSRIKQYANGVMVADVPFVHTIVADTRPLMIGADTPGFFEVFNGKIDDLRIYNRALTSGEIAELAAQVTGVEEQQATLSFSAPRPNPSREGFTADFSLPVASDVTIALYDAAGRLVRTLARERMEAGPHGIAWDGRDQRGADAPAGLYFLGLRSGDQQRWARVVRVR